MTSLNRQLISIKDKEIEEIPIDIKPKHRPPPPKHIYVIVIHGHVNKLIL